LLDDTTVRRYFKEFKETGIDGLFVRGHLKPDREGQVKPGHLR
jgi:hypothetical protein